MECLSYVGEAFHDSHLRDTTRTTKPANSLRVRYRHVSVELTIRLTPDARQITPLRQIPVTNSTTRQSSQYTSGSIPVRAM